jgi:hypothetical protein
LSLHPRITSSNPAEDDGFLKTIKIRSMMSFRGEVKPSVPTGMKKILHRQNSRTFLSPVQWVAGVLSPKLNAAGA